MAKRGKTKRSPTALQLARSIAKKVGGKKVTNLRTITDPIGNIEEWDADTVAGFVVDDITIVLAVFETAEAAPHVNIGVFDTTDPTKAGPQNNIDRDTYFTEASLLHWVREVRKEYAESNPVHQLRVTASTKAKAKTKASKFGRVMDIQHRGGDQYAVKVDQPKMGNPVLSWLPAERKKQWAALTDTQLREEIADLREEIRLNKAAIKKLGKRPTLQQMVAHGVPQELWEENEMIQREIDGIKAVLEARKAERRAKREAKKPPKTPVMRRRKGVVSRINPKSSKRVKSVRSLVREALK